jgi:hypothetical protein
MRRDREGAKIAKEDAKNLRVVISDSVGTHGRGARATGLFFFASVFASFAPSRFS